MIRHRITERKGQRVKPGNFAVSMRVVSLWDWAGKNAGCYNKHLRILIYGPIINTSQRAKREKKMKHLIVQLASGEIITDVVESEDIACALMLHWDQYGGSSVKAAMISDEE